MNQTETDNHSRALQKPVLSSVEAHDLALKVLAMLREERSDACFKKFWFFRTKIHTL